VISSPSRTISATDASSSSARAVGHGRRTHPLDLTAFAGLGVPAGEGGAVDRHLDLDRLARTFTRQCNESVCGIGRSRLAPPGAPSFAEDPVEVPFPRRAEPRTGVGGQARFEAIHPIGIGPLTRPSLDVQAARPRLVVFLRAGADLPTPVAQALDAR
jgi:hypothetical protein